MPPISGNAHIVQRVCVSRSLKPRPMYVQSSKEDLSIFIRLHSPQPHRHLQFNCLTVDLATQTQMLATQSNGLTRLWRLSDNTSSKPLVHLRGLETAKWSSVRRQYAWAPDGSRILTRRNLSTEVRHVVGIPVLHYTLPSLSHTRTVMRGPLTFWRDGIQVVVPGGYQMVRYHGCW